MKYAPRHYAEALHQALEGKKAEERKRVLQKFDVLLRKNGDTGIKNLILKNFESLDLKKRGLRKVTIESAQALSETDRQNIKKTIAVPIELEEKVNPGLLAGLTILIDDSLYIDASARTKIKNLFA